MRLLFLIALVCGLLPAVTSELEERAVQAGTVPASDWTQSDRYDPSRDPEKDLAAACAEAKNSNKYLFVVVGGEWCVWCVWCVWCHIMDEFFHEHQDLMLLRDKNYVLLKVNMSRENMNRTFDVSPSQYSRIPAHIHPGCGRKADSVSAIERTRRRAQL
jgi:thiol:disulfide interchange protein